MNNQYELYKLLKPIFNVKKRLSNYYKYTLNDSDIWKYLSKKWKKSHDLTLSEIVNDIMILDIKEISENEAK